jgi:hypothetical protein
MKTRILISSVLVASALSACSSSDKGYESSELAENIPDWVLNPTIENGLAASDCTKFSGNMSVDSKVAVANARLALAQQISVQVQGLDKTYARRTDTNEETSVGSNFSSVSKQITQQNLSGALVKKVDIVNILNAEHLCAQVTLAPSETEALFEKLVVGSQQTINAKDKTFLYEEFKAFKAEQDLDSAIKSLTN